MKPDDVVRRHGHGDNSPQKRPRASEEKEEVVGNGTPSTDEGRYFIFQTKVETDNEPLQLADRYFELVTFRQQKGTTAKSTDWGETTPFKQTSRRTRMQLQQHESPPVRKLRLASIGKGRHRLTRISSMTPAGLVMIRSFLPKWPCCILYALLCVFLFCFTFLAISHVIIPGIKGNENYPLTMETIGTCIPEE